MSWKLPEQYAESSSRDKSKGEFRGFGLPARLEAVASCVGIGAKVADVGTDHGLLPIALVGSGRASHAIAADLRPKPLSMAKKNVERFGKQGQVDLRLGDGLSVLKPFEADTVTIAGMSGRRMVEIIRSVDLLHLEVDRLILQPNSDQLDLRQNLSQDGWGVAYERLVVCGHRMYVVIVFERVEQPSELNREEALVGPFLSRTPEQPIFQLWCRMMADLIQVKVDGLRQGGVRADELLLAERDLASFQELIA